MIFLEFGDLVAIACEVLEVEVDEALDQFNVDTAQQVLDGSRHAAESAGAEGGAAALLMGLVTSPPVGREVSRVAMVATLQFLGLNGFSLIDTESAPSLVARIRTGETKITAVADWFRHHIAVSGIPSDEDVVRRYLTDVARYPRLSRADEAGLGGLIQAGRSAQRRLESEDQELTPDERAELKRRIDDGAEVQTSLIRCNLRLVASLAERHKESGVPFIDLVQEGNLGLLRAVERHDWTKEHRFSTSVTWWARQAIGRAVENRGRTVSSEQPGALGLVPDDLAALLAGLNDVERKVLECRFGLDRGEPRTLDEVAETLGMTPDEVCRIEAEAMNKLREIDGGDDPSA